MLDSEKMDAIKTMIDWRWKSSAVTIAIAGWVLLMVSVPIWGWTVGETAQHRAIMWGVVAQAVATIVVVRREWSWGKTAAILFTVALTTLVVEVIGAETGWPFGRYYYTDLMQPQLFHVPLLIPLAWFMMLPAAWAISRRFWPNRVQFAIVSGLAFTAWDLFLDPQLVNWGFWVWEQPGAYFGIPLTNYVGWFGTAALLSFLLHPFAKFKSNSTIIALLIIYTITWFLEWFGLAFFWRLWGAAVVGFFVMGVFVWLGWHFPSTSLDTI